MSKKIISIGVEIPSANIENASIRSQKSLLDWDIIIFRPDIDAFPYGYDDTYMGKVAYNDSASVSFNESSQHWRQQIESAIKEGKTVFLYLTKLEEVYVATGRKEFSGTGRNQKVTRHVALSSNYKFAPIPSGWKVAEGREMRVAQSHRGMLASYWERFEKLSIYYVFWEENKPEACIYTKSGGRPVAFFSGPSESGGNLFLLPDLDFENEDFAEYDDKGREVWTEAGIQFAESLVAELVHLAKAAASESQKSASPEWIDSPQFLLPGEEEARQESLRLEEEIQKLQAAKGKSLDDLNEITSLKDLLFESGRPLEFAIIMALKILGFKAENFDDGASEFDVVFSSSEGRLLGEAEGKDNKEVNISKLRQLSTNIMEDLDREEVDEPAKGVLFGNAFRYVDPSKRGKCFSDKCIKTANTTSIALVETAELYRATRYILLTKDEQFARRVREKMLTTVGLVDFEVPEEGNEEQPKVMSGK